MSSNGSKIIVTGAGGRMGRSLIEAVGIDDSATLVAAVVRSGSDYLNLDAGELSGVGRIGEN